MPTLGKCGCCGFKFPDFITKAACVPLAVNHYGVNVTDPWHLELVESHDLTYNKMVMNVKPDFAHGASWWYRTVDTVDTYQGGVVITTHSEVFKFFANPANLMQNAHDSTPQNPDPASDMTKAGLLPQTEDTLIYHSQTGDFNQLDQNGNPRPTATNTEVELNLVNDGGLPPLVVSEDDWTIRYAANEDTDPPPPGASLLLKTKHITLGAKRTIGDVDTEAQAALAGILLTPNSESTNSIGTREGDIYLDYFGLDSTFASAQLIPSGATYGPDLGSGYGVYEVTVPANQILGIRCGDNEYQTGGTAQVFRTSDDINLSPGDLNTDQTFPYYWGLNDPAYRSPYDGVLDTPIKMPAWFGGHTGWNGATADTPNCHYFVSRLTTVKICGTPGAPVTAKIAVSHANRVLVFPTNGVSVVTICSTQTIVVAGRNTSFSFLFPAGYYSGITLNETRFRWAVTPPASDGTQFGDFDPWMPVHCLKAFQSNLNDNSDLTGVPFGNIPNGESVYGPGDVGAPWGYLVFNSVEELPGPAAPTVGAGREGVGVGDGGGGIG